MENLKTTSFEYLSVLAMGGSRGAMEELDRRAWEATLAGDTGLAQRAKIIAMDARMKHKVY